MSKRFVPAVSIVLAVFMCVSAWANVPIDANNFPDNVFRSYVIYRFDSDDNRSLSDEEIAEAKIITVNGLGISTLQGIEHFTALRGLDCRNNSLDVLDLSSNQELVLLYCGNNNLEKLNVNNCSSLGKIDCTDNKLSKLDTSDNAELMELYCSENTLQELDVSENIYLTSLDCSANELTSLKLSGDILLESLICRNNNLTVLDVSTNRFLSIVDCHSNDIQRLDFRKNVLLQALGCRYNGLKTLDLSANKYLMHLICSDNLLESLDVSNCESLVQIICRNNKIVSLDLSGKQYLNYVDCVNNNLESLNVENCPSLSELFCYDNVLTLLNLNNCSALEILGCWSNRLKTLDFSTNPSLSSLVCNRNDLRELNLRSCKKLETLDCQNNGLTELDLTENTLLTTLLCRNNFLQVLDVSRNTALDILDCPYNFLTTIDVSKNTSLLSFDCSLNNIYALDVSANTSLEYLKCSQDIKSLYVIPSGNSSYPFKMDMKEYISQDTSRIESVIAYSDSGKVVASNFDDSERVLFLASQPHHVIYKYDVKYSGPAPDVEKSMKVVIGMPRLHFLVPGNMKWLANTVLAEEILNAAANAFTGMSTSNVHPFTGIITSETWKPEEADITALSEIGEDILFNLPETQAEIDGIYVIMCLLGSDVNPDDKLEVYDLAGNGSVHESEYVFLDEIGRTINYAGNNKQLYLAMKFSAGQVNRNVVVIPSNVSPASSTGSSGGGCNSGYGIIAGLLSVIFANMLSSCGSSTKRRTGIIMLTIILALTSGAFADEGVRTSDYVLPIPFEMYTPAGICTVDFEFTQEIAEKIAEKWQSNLNKPVTSSQVHSFADIALPGTWNLRPGDLRNLAEMGQYGAALLPITQLGTSRDVYVALCTFSNDVKPGEALQIYALTIDTERRENVQTIDLENEEWTPEGFSSGYYLVLDENLNEIKSVPKNRKAYVAVNLSPEGVNTGIVTVIRGRYISEDDPLSRIEPSLAQFIADSFGISVDKLKYLRQEEISAPREATDEIKKYIASNDREIMLNMPTVSVDEGYKAVYFAYTLPDDVWQEVKDKKIDDYTIYALNDSEVSGSSKVRSSAILSGLISLWELNGGKMETFGVKEFVIAGLLQSGTPFSLYLTKILLALLMGGCSSGVNPVVIPIVIMGIIFVKFSRRH